MNKSLPLALCAAAIVSGLAAQSATAQPYSGQQYPSQGGYPTAQQQGANRANPYDDAYRAGYRAGYQAGRKRAQYDDRPAPSNYYGGGDPGQRWRLRDGQTYRYNDDRFYQECRNKPDPAGILAGAIIGGLVGNAVGHGGGRGGATVAGVIVGGVAGAALTQHLDCEDRSYAYKTYSEGFNSGRPNSNWQWDNPGNGHYGDFRVGDYYNDADGFRCATYTQQIWVDGVPQRANGRACRQPDGAWTIVN
jgi:surface antigen